MIWTGLVTDPTFFPLTRTAPAAAMAGKAIAIMSTVTPSLACASKASSMRASVLAGWPLRQPHHSQRPPNSVTPGFAGTSSFP